MDEEARSQQIRAAAIRWLWGSLAVVCYLGVLAPPTVLLRWWDASAMCLLGFISGLAVSYAIVHSEEHAHALYYALLALGLILLPGLAVFLGGVGAGRSAVFASWNVMLTAFIAYALATTALCVALSEIRRSEAAQEARSEQVEQVANWLPFEGENPPEQPTGQPSPPTQPPVSPLGTQGA